MAWAPPSHVQADGLSKFIRQLPDARFEMPDKKESMTVLSELLKTGKLTPHVDKTFPLAEAADAIRYLQDGCVKGKVVLTM